MDKNAIRKYAVWARQELLARVAQKAEQYGVTEKEIIDPGASAIHGRLLSPTERGQRRQLIDRMRQHGYKAVIDEVAYTWFNRFIALRFMEVNGYLPSHVRVFTDEQNAFKPQMLAEALHLELPGLDMEKVIQLKTEDKTEELYKYLLITQCNALSDVLPQMFQRIADYTELLLPDNLLRDGSVIDQLVKPEREGGIPERDWTDQVQIIGWLYQYYNAEPKDQVFANLKKNIKADSRSIPAATQLFTPDWIVRYMVENSLGRLWLEGHPNDALKAAWKYDLDEAEQTPEVRAQLAGIREERKSLRPEDIRCIDPCMGSGHILVYMFDVLMQIYEAYGYSSRDAVRSIIEHNLYGLDIDDRAAQLAYFAVMMKARQYDRRFLTRRDENGHPDAPQAQVYSTTSVPDGEAYGSLLCFEEPGPEPARADLLDPAEAAWHVRRILSQRYHVVVTNPPYMGSGNMNSQLATFVKNRYPDSKSDLSTAFMEKTLELCTTSGYMAMINIPVWMFLSSFEKLREKILENHTYINMVHPGRGIFGSDFGTTTFVIAKQHISGYMGSYRRLFDVQGEVKGIEEREEAFLAGKGKFVACQDNFAKIPGAPVAYWVKKMTDNFQKGKRLAEICETRKGLATSDNERFLRLWYEVAIGNISFSTKDNFDTTKNQIKWYPLNKGGSFRRWYGNREYIINWENNGHEIRNYKDSHGKLLSRPQNTQYNFKPALTWSKITSADFSARYCEGGFLFDDAAAICYHGNKKLLKYILGFLNTCCCQKTLNILNPTINIQIGDIGNLPILLDDSPNNSHVEDIIDTCISLSRTDWDAFETSWDFQRHPLVRGAGTVRAAYEAWARECDERFARLKANEEELNRIFIDIYGLQDELTPDVADKDVTVRRADLGRDVRSLISYAVGCMFGRYSLDVPGLAYAGGDFSEQWVVVRDQYYLREVVEKYVSDELSRVDRLAKIYGFGRDGLSPCEIASQNGDLCPVGSNTQSGSFCPIQYRRGTGKKLYEGICELSVHCQRVLVGAGNPAYDLCSPEILRAIADRSSAELVSRGWQDAERIDWSSIHQKLTTNHYPLDTDNVLPICDDEYFTDDIVGKFVAFVRTVYGEDTLEENLKFIAGALGGSGTPREVIRQYFLNGFYADHLKIYQKRPIYWLFDSGKKNGFKCLIYMHRYRPDTVARIRTDYVHEQQSRYRTAIADLEKRVSEADAASRVRLTKQLNKLQAQAEETRLYEEKIHHLADQMIPIDLDDGVKVNYEKFRDVLAPIK